jgi:hypothetical protein
MSITQEQWNAINNVNYDIIYKIFEWLSEEEINDTVIETKTPSTPMYTPPPSPVSKVELIK